MVTKKSRKNQKMIDSHAHLTFKQLNNNIDSVIKRAKDAGLTAIITIGSGENEDGNEKPLRLQKNIQITFSQPLEYTLMMQKD